MTEGYKNIDFSDNQRKELIRLMLGMSVVKTTLEFDMADYASIKDDKDVEISPYMLKNECGTAACFMGHAPLFCKLKPDDDWNWGLYAFKLFGRDNTMAIHNFLFSSGWSNSKDQAVARAYIVLTKGIPKGINISSFNEIYDVPSNDEVKEYAAKHGIIIDELKGECGTAGGMLDSAPLFCEKKPDEMNNN